MVADAEVATVSEVCLAAAVQLLAEHPVAANEHCIRSWTYCSIHQIAACPKTNHSCRQPTPGPHPSILSTLPDYLEALRVRQRSTLFGIPGPSKRE
jgi:hypothetical protein